MEPITFTVDGVPIAQKRHRAKIIYRAVFGRFRKKIPVPLMYDPSADDKENFLKKALQYAPDKPLKGPISLHVTFNMPPAKDLSSLYLHATKPDIDNLAKFVMDALAGKFWVDDCQICYTTFNKVHSGHPRTDICMRALRVTFCGRSSKGRKPSP